MAENCDTLSGPAWAWCLATNSYTEAVETSSEAAVQIADAVTGTAGTAISGAQKVGKELAKSTRGIGSINLSAGSVVAIAAIGVGGALLLDGYLTGGSVTRSIGRTITGRR